MSPQDWAREARAAFLDGYIAVSGTDLRAHRTLLDAFEVHRTDGAGGLLDPVIVPLASPTALDLGDLDGDGADDVAVAQSRTTGIGAVQRVAVYRTTLH